MDNEEKLKLLFDQAKVWYSTLIDFIFKHSTLQIIILGWSLTSKEAHDSIRQLDHHLRPIPAVLIVGYSVMVFFIYRRIATKSGKVLSHIRTLDEGAFEIAQTYELKRAFWLSMAAVHLILSAVTIFLLYCSYSAWR